MRTVQRLRERVGDAVHGDARVAPPSIARKAKRERHARAALLRARRPLIVRNNTYT